METYFYELNAITHEESTKRTFWSSVKLTKGTFYKKIERAVNAFLDDELKKKVRDSKDSLSWRQFIYVLELLDMVPDSYFEKVKLYPLKIKASLTFWGWNDIGVSKKGDFDIKRRGKDGVYMWKYDSSDIDKKFINSVKKKVVTLLKVAMAEKGAKKDENK